jgi:hypothetical protein
MAINTPDELVREIVLGGSTQELVKGMVWARTAQFLKWLPSVPGWQTRDVDDLRILYHSHLYRLAQAQKIVSLFVTAHRRQPKDSAELDKWIGSPAGKAALALHTGRDGKIIP